MVDPVSSAAGWPLAGCPRRARGGGPLGHRGGGWPRRRRHRTGRASSAPEAGARPPATTLYPTSGAKLFQVEPQWTGYLPTSRRLPGGPGQSVGDAWTMLLAGRRRWSAGCALMRSAPGRGGGPQTAGQPTSGPSRMDPRRLGDADTPIREAQVQAQWPGSAKRANLRGRTAVDSVGRGRTWLCWRSASWSTLWLEIVLLTRLSVGGGGWRCPILPVAALFVVWDLYAIGQGHWYFDPALINAGSCSGGCRWTVLFFHGDPDRRGADSTGSGTVGVALNGWG